MVAAFLGVALVASPAPDYTNFTVEGWTVPVHRDVLARREAWASAKRELQTQLYRVAHVVPDGPLAKLRQVQIWVHWTSPETKCMAYHPGSQWLREHKMNPAMEKHVEIGDLRAFVDWTYEQPWMVLHELAHAYHDRFLEKGFENPEVIAVLTKSKEAKRYESVVHWDGKDSKHYALTNQMEYFAETTEAYFGQNDFYPFVRAELMRYDLDGFALMERVWGNPQKRVPGTQ